MPQYDISGITSTMQNGKETFSVSEVWMIISVLLAVMGGLYLFSNFFSKDKSSAYTGLKKKIYDFLHFKITIIEPIFKVLYLITSITITLSSFTFIFGNFFKFIAILVFGNLIARLAFELLLLTLKMISDISEINTKLFKNKKTEDKKTD